MSRSFIVYMTYHQKSIVDTQCGHTCKQGHHIPSSNLFLYGYEGIMYDETYGVISQVIYEVIMRKI